MATDLPLTYPDLVCNLDLDAYAAETTSDLQTLTQDVLHVLLEFPGSNLDDPGRGIGVFQYLGGTSDQFQHLARTIEAQLVRDDRIDSVYADVTQESDGTWSLLIRIEVDGAVVPLQYGWQNGEFTYLGEGAING